MSILKTNAKKLILTIFAVAIMAGIGAIRANIAKSACAIDCTGTGSPLNNCDYDVDIWTSSNKICTVGDVTSQIAVWSTVNPCVDTANTQACRHDSCPSFNYRNGSACNIISANGIFCDATEIASGIWDASGSRCILCSGKKEGTANSLCGTTSATYASGSSCTGTGDGNFEIACDNDNMVASDCDDKAEGDWCDSPSNTKKCNASGICAEVGVNALSLSIVSAPNPVTVGGTSVITFTVKKTSDSSPVSGAVVDVKSISCTGGALPDPAGSTNASGQITSTFTAPGSAAICTVNVEATRSGYTKGIANFSITITNCMAPDFSSYDNGNGMYANGELLTLKGHNTRYFSLCIYDNNGNFKEDGLSPFDSILQKNITFTANSLGTWRGLAIPSPDGESCPGTFDLNNGCPSSIEVVECYDGHPGNCISGCDLSTYTCEDSAPLPSPALPACDQLFCGGGVTNVSCMCNEVRIDISGNYCCAAAFDGTGGTGSFASPEACKAAYTACADAPPPPPPSVPCGNAIVDDPSEVCDINLSSSCSGGKICNSTCTACIDPPCSGVSMYESPLSFGYCSIGEIITKSTNWILSLVSSIIVLILIIGGLMYISSAGDEERLRASKNIIQYAAIGLGIILISYALITEVTNILKG